MAKQRSLYIEILNKAWKEFGFIEVLSESIGGLVLAAIAFSKGWINGESASELCLECVGCAILIPAIAFILRVFCVAPSELLKESKAVKNGHEISPKSIYPSIIAMLLAFCSLLIVILIFSIKFGVSQIAKATSMNEVAITNTPQKQEVTQKRYAVKEIIKTNAQPMAANQEPATNSSVAATNSEPQKFTEVFKPNDESHTNYLDVLADTIQKQAEEQKIIDRAVAEKSELEKRSALNATWTNLLPHFQHTLTSLHGAVYNIANSQRTNISETYYIPTHFPAEIKSSREIINIADVGLQNNTNWNFNILVRTTEPMTDFNSRFILSISCPGGSVDVMVDGLWTGSYPMREIFFHRMFRLVPEKYKALALRIPDSSSQSLEKLDDATDTAIDILISVNRQFLIETQTNKSVTLMP
jgi:hypothetical protein